VGGVDWSDYLADFHAGRPGITEQVLRRARGAGGDPYGWLAAAVPPEGVVLDVACGSAPLWPRLPGRTYVGVDLSAAELAVARRRGPDLLARASATALPLDSGSVDVVVCSMALQVLTPLPAALAEIARVLKPGGRLVATVPDRGPLRVTDVPMLAGLLAALGRGLGYPNDTLLGRLPDLLSAVGLRLVVDERQRFDYRLADAAYADLFLASLYLPDLPARRYRAAQAFLRTLARVRARLPVPIRRVVASRR
jgi:SAM-dependent methyltransferase